MTPQKKGVVPDELAARLRAAVADRDAAVDELHAAVVAALLAGGSVREVERISGVARNTVERWGHAGGWPSAEQKAGWEEDRRIGREIDRLMDASTRHARYMKETDDE